MAARAAARVVWMVRWSNPHRVRPEGVAEVFLQVERDDDGRGAGQCPQEIYECWEEMRPYGYAIACYTETAPARVLSLAVKHRIRRRNLWKRMVRRYPLFAESFYQERVESKPDYYGAFTAGEFAAEEVRDVRKSRLRQSR